MALRRDLLKAAILAAAVLALLPAAAFAAPQWLGADPLEPSAALVSAPRVAADANGNSVAVWLGAAGQVNAAYRPRGGPWGPGQNLDPGTAVSTVPPRVTVQPDGEFIAVWIAQPGATAVSPLRWSRRPAGEGWSPPATIDGIAGGPPGLSALQASADGSVLVVSTSEGTPSSHRKPAGSETWGPSEGIGTGTGTEVAVAPDGSAVAANTGSCSDLNCIRAAYRPPAGPWGPSEQAALTGSATVTGLAVAAGPASSYTVVWAERSVAGPPGAVRSSDRSAGAGGVWDAAPTLVANLPTDSPGCSQAPIGCIDLAIGGDGTQLAVWQQAGASGDLIGANLRPGGGDWGAPEQAGATAASATSVVAGITSGGTPVAAWPVNVPRGVAVARGSHRAEAGGWVPEDLGTPASGTAAALDDLAVDGDGNAVTAWRDPSGDSAAGFDGAGPRFSSFSVPGAGTVGQALAFSAAADDDWSGVASNTWLFGDGGSFAGGTLNHAYLAAGTFTATATATDGVGNASQRSGSTAVSATPTPSPDPCGTTDRDKDGIKDACDKNDGSRRPVAFKTVNATVVSGDVFIKLPAGAARAAAAKPPKGFVRLRGAETIPVGSTLDTAKGRVALRSASDTRRHVQSGQFFRGRFVISQVRKPRGKAKRRSTKLITVLTLSGSSFSKTCKAKPKASTAKKRRSKKRVRRLFGDGKGAFRTRGRNAAATVRGTRWSVQDRCDGTLVTVQRGRVSVRDLVRHRTVLVKTGHTYLARRR